MVRFGRHLAAQARQEWKQHYVDYEALKRCINDCREAQREAEARPERARLLQARQAIFQGRLDSEVLKVLDFYRRRSRELLQRVDRVAAEAGAVLEPERLDALPRGPDRAAALDAAAQAVQGLLRETTQLLQYVALNMAALRKALKKYAKNVAATNQPLAGFLALEVAHPDDPGWRVLQGTYLPASVAEDLAAMQQHPELLAAMERLRGLVAAAGELRARLASRPSMSLPREAMDRRLGSMAVRVEEMVAAEEEAARHASLVHAVPWAERAAGMFEPPPPDEFAAATLGGLVLNNASAALFLANYTAVLPPTDALCVRIGVSSSYTGLIMAASDLAALPASLGISLWTQRSFKQPLLASSLACLAGNLLFVAAYQRRSLGALLAARLLNGLGSARAANRRYTADYVSRARRTMASAAFVASSNLGMALGPLLSLPLALLPERCVAGLALNPVTAVGWVMALAWLAFILATLAWFQEPPKRLPIGLASSSLPASRSASPAEPLLGHTAGGTTAADVEQPRTGAGGQRGLLVHAALAKQASAAATAAAAGAGKGLAASAWRSTLPATAACTLALFVQKAVQQGYLDSLPLLAEALLCWRPPQQGLFLGLLCAAMVPVNLAVGAASAHASDRSLVLGSLAACAAALAALAAGAAASPALFLGGGAGLLAASVALEGCATSLMSKVIWRGFATGVLNAGLLSTEAGTLGRFAGNGLLWGAGRAAGLGQEQLPRFAAVLFGTLGALCCALLACLACAYRRLKG